jgi:hypothetical protein
MTRTRIGLALATATIGIVGTLGLAACGPVADGSAAGVSVVSAEGQALAAMGFDPADLAAADQGLVAADPTAAATPSATGGPTDRAGNRKRRPGRVFLGKHVMHGEAVVETGNGTKTVDVQRGTVTAIDDKTVTVKSADGFTLTWTFGTPIHVVEHRTTVQPSAIKVGTEIGLAGVKEGSTVTARLIVIPRKK